MRCQDRNFFSIFYLLKVNDRKNNHLNAQEKYTIEAI